MRKIAERQTKHGHTFLLFHSLHFMLLSDSKKLMWPNSPLLVMLQFVDPSVLSPASEESRSTALHDLAQQSDTSDYSVHENLLILAKQLIAHGANVNAVSTSRGDTPLHRACHSANVTNLDFIELLLEEGADPNAQDHLGRTPLGNCIRFAPGAAKFLLNWPTTDVNLTARSGGKSFLARVREAEFYITNEIARPDNPEKVQHQFLLRQWRGIEDMLVERGP
jgi:ankyrin repeat protein